MRLQLEPITKPSGEEYESLLNDPATVRHMPLHSGYMSAADCEEWAKNKAAQWSNPELGPWSIYVDGKFAGWGGLQPESDGEAGLALVLKKDFWGLGLELFEFLIKTFRECGSNQPIVMLLATSRNPVKVMERFGFTFEGEVEEGGATFYRFRLTF